MCAVFAAIFALLWLASLLVYAQWTSEPTPTSRGVQWYITAGGLGWGSQGGGFFLIDDLYWRPGWPAWLPRREIDYWKAPHWFLPMWPAVVGFAAGYWWLRPRRALPGFCPKCGYSLAGLAPGAACPECGKGGDAG